MPDQPDFKYFAFISYSHRDKKWGDWLHKALETYKVPKRLHGHAPDGQALPKRLFPVFRDREELPTSASLGAQITDALARSRYLIVICSPHAAQSVWVNEEIKTFKAMGRENRILSLIVDGEPNAADKPEGDAAECFPPALRFRLDAAGNPGQERSEPIAADARPGKDGKKNALLKLAAGLLGVSFDDLKQREQERRVRRLMAAGAVMAMLMTLFAGLAWRAWVSERKAVASEQAAKKSEDDAKRRLASQQLGLAQAAIEECRWSDAIIYYKKSLELVDSMRARIGGAFALRHTITEITTQNSSIPNAGRTFLSNSGKLKATISGQNTIYLCDRLEKKCNKIVLPEEFSQDSTANNLINTLVFGGEKWLAACLSSNKIVIWDTIDTTNPHIILNEHEYPVRRWPGDAQGVLTASFSQDNKFFATGGNDSIVLWSTKNYDKTKINTNSKVNCISFSHNNKYIIAGLEDGLISINTTTNSIISQANYLGNISAIAFKNDDTGIVIGTTAGELKELSIPNLDSATHLGSHKSPISHIAVTNDDSFIIYSDNSTSMRLLHPQGNIPDATIHSESGTESLVLTNNNLGTEILSSGSNGEIKEWTNSNSTAFFKEYVDISDAIQQEPVIYKYREIIKDIHSKTDNYIPTSICVRNNSYKAKYFSERSRLVRISADDSLNCDIVCTEKPYILAGDYNNNNSLVDYTTDEEILNIGDIAHYREDGLAAYFLDNGNRLAFINTDSFLTIVNTNNGNKVATFKLLGFYIVPTISNHGKYIAWIDDHSTNITIVDAITGKQIDIRNTRNAKIKALSFSNDEKRLLVISDDSILSYNMDDTNLIRKMNISIHINNIDISPDDTLAVIASDDGIYLYDIENAELITYFLPPGGIDKRDDPVFFLHDGSLAIDMFDNSFVLDIHQLERSVILKSLTEYTELGLSYQLDDNGLPVPKDREALTRKRLEAAKAGRIWWREDGGWSLVPLYENELQQARAAAATPAN
ncbi:toll/interleukin-1 receptor domain-containing protein [Solidesulfovibrio alcoholivorans]|uniref:toll/interleukin-1 receptor domain-containing protein n=1 Tax=Solidesulfovibrio alcoholivorans TaxID=81406 RepID=UPI000A01B785|nr:TIR domain-containing protein [Solidesulfovibrio alcoholivorans]